MAAYPSPNADSPRARLLLGKRGHPQAEALRRASDRSGRFGAPTRDNADSSRQLVSNDGLAFAARGARKPVRRPGSTFGSSWERLVPSFFRHSTFSLRPSDLQPARAP